MTGESTSSTPAAPRRGVHPLPAALSGARLAAALVMILSVHLGLTPVALFWLVLGAALSDYLDGWLARCIKRCSYEGKILDFLADKVFLAVSLLVLSMAGAPHTTIVAPVVASYHLVVLLATTIVSWGTGRPLIAVPTGEKLVHIFSYVLASAAAGAAAFTGKGVYLKIAEVSGYLTLAAVAFGAAGYLRLVRRLLVRFPK